MNHDLTQDADLIFHCIGGQPDRTPPSFDDAPPFDTQVVLNDKLANMPPERFTEAIRFLVRMEMVQLIPSGECSCGSPRYDVIPINRTSPPPSSCNDERQG